MGVQTTMRIGMESRPKAMFGRSAAVSAAAATMLLGASKFSRAARNSHALRLGQPPSGLRGRIARLALRALFTIIAVQATFAQSTQPFVAIHDSELTRSLESMNAVAPTPTGPGTTGKQWWPTDWHYFVMPESLKEALRSDGTAFTVVDDSNVTAGVLLDNGQPKYPIVVSLASEAIRDDEIAAFTNYVASVDFCSSVLPALPAIRRRGAGPISPLQMNSACICWRPD